jgi:hypothetical protein
MLCNILSNIKPKELEGIMKPSAKYNMRLRGTILITNEILSTYLFGSNQHRIHPMATIRIHLRFKKRDRWRSYGVNR